MKKIGLITSFKELNYGAVLQAYALKNTIEKLGYTCEIIWLEGSKSKYNDIRVKKVISMAKKMLLNPTIINSTIHSYKKAFTKDFTLESKYMFDEFQVEYIKANLYKYSVLKKKEQEYQYFVCGSDQIWNSYAAYVDPMYYLRFTDKSKRIAYAPSFGKNDVPQYNYKTIRKYISEFQALSVREQEGARICKDLINKEVPVVLDPTLLLDAQTWKSILPISSVEDDNKYCLLYFLDYPSKAALAAIREVKSRFKIKYLPYEFECFFDDDKSDAGPIEFLNLINNAEYILTDSFHGTVFSINFNKKFLTFKRDYGKNQDQSSRLKNILQLLSLENRYIEHISNATKLIDDKIDYINVENKLNELRRKSLNYLKNSLR